MEYEQLQSKPPEGVYVMPSLTNVLEWHGVLFVRQGPYARLALTTAPRTPG